MLEVCIFNLPLTSRDLEGLITGPTINLTGVAAPCRRQTLLRCTVGSRRVLLRSFVLIGRMYHTTMH